MKKRKILIVEDEKGMRETLDQAFDEAGFEVLLSEDGDHAMKMVREEGPDIILLDIILPKKDGFEFLKELREDKEAKDVPVILCTNLSDMKDIQRAIDLGARTYLLKADYSLSDIVKKIKGMLGE